jgi:hypothetical protein
VCVALARAAANIRLLTSRKDHDLAVLSGLVIAIGAQVTASLEVSAAADSLHPGITVPDVQVVVRRSALRRQSVTPLTGPPSSCRLRGVSTIPNQPALDTPE